VIIMNLCNFLSCIRVLGNSCFCGNLYASCDAKSAHGRSRGSSINANYKFPWLPALFADITVQHFGTSPASVDEVARPAQTALWVGGRYRFKQLGVLLCLFGGGYLVEKSANA
jgi:hypothetical protein